VKDRPGIDLLIGAANIWNWDAADRSVQQTLFSNGVVVTVNFGPAAYRMADGHEIKPLDLRIQGI